MKEKISLSRIEIKYIITALCREADRRDRIGDEKVSEIMNEIGSDLAEILDNRQKSIRIE